MRKTPLTLIVAATIVAFVSIAPLAQQQEPAPAPDQAPARDTAKSPAWDVTAPLGGATSTVAFETDEGTWMNVDVSPDGREIVFDLLGDIYVMPIDGTGDGEARRITSGPAFDMQPR